MFSLMYASSNEFQNPILFIYRKTRVLIPIWSWSLAISGTHLVRQRGCIFRDVTGRRENSRKFEEIKNISKRDGRKQWGSN